jgi:hypothetical protein
MPHAASVILWGVLFVTGLPASATAQSQWKAHDMSRPRPRIVDPGPEPGAAPVPADAIVLFDGTDLSQWGARAGGDAGWTLGDGYFEVKPGAGDIRTRRGFGDVQLHIEWSAPTGSDLGGQDRGNSGIYLMEHYEIQILDSHENETYADGQAAAVYGQHPPLVNAMRPPGHWQSYDIVFRRPRFGIAGELAQNARVTLLHNGIVVQDAAKIWGPAGWLEMGRARPHADRLPIVLQDHGSAVRFRNIWLRELRETPPPRPPADYLRPVVRLPAELLERYVGRYRVGQSDFYIRVARAEHTLQLILGEDRVDLVAHAPDQFAIEHTAADVRFELDEQGQPTTLDFQVGETRVTGIREQP